LSEEAKALLWTGLLEYYTKVMYDRAMWEVEYTKELKREGLI
jgi:hypothetical protein